MAKRSTGKTVSGGGTATKPRQHSLVWLQGLLCGAMVTLATPTALLLGVLLGPALLALMLDRQPGRPKARSIALCSMAASIDPLRTLWMTGHSMADRDGAARQPAICRRGLECCRRRLAVGGGDADRGTRRT